MTEFNPFGPKASSTGNLDVRSTKSAHMQNLGMGGGSSNSVGTQTGYPDHSDMPMPKDCEEKHYPHQKCQCWRDAVEKALRATYDDMTRDLLTLTNYHNELSSIWVASNDEGGCGGYRGSWQVWIPRKPCPAWLPGETPLPCETKGPIKVSCDYLLDRMRDYNEDTHALSAACAAYLEKHGQDFGKTGQAVYDKCMGWYK